MAFLLKILGFICVALAAIGVFLPILPTTPFLLLAVYLFSKSYPQMIQRLKDNSLLGTYLTAYYSDGARMSVKQKVVSFAVLWGTILASIIFFTHILWVRIVLAAVGVGVSVHLSLLPVRREGDSEY